MFILATVLAFATTISLTSCNEDLCKNVDCGAHGTCKEGVCDCEAGYETDTNGRCDLLSNQKFVGKFKQIDKAQTTADTAFCSETYDIVIKAVAANISKIEIDNFAGSGTKFLATIPSTAPTTFTIDPNQSFGASGIIFFGTGSGKISADGKTLTITYEFTSGGKKIFGCTASGIKQ